MMVRGRNCLVFRECTVPTSEMQHQGYPWVAHGVRGEKQDLSSRKTCLRHSGRPGPVTATDMSKHAQAAGLSSMHSTKLRLSFFIMTQRRPIGRAVSR